MTDEERQASVAVSTAGGPGMEFPADGPVVGIFGGSFNPPHVSHVLACLYVLSTHPVEKIMVIPSFLHPLDKELLEYKYRLEMTRLAFTQLSGWVEVSRIEEEIGGVSYTVDTLTELKRREPATRFRLIVGSDILGEVEKWRRFDEVARLAPLLVVPRLSADPKAVLKSGESTAPIAPDSSFYLPAISSTVVRDLLRAGHDPGGAIPLSVKEYIKAHGLYRQA